MKGPQAHRRLGCRLVALVSSRRRFFVTLLLLVATALAIRTTFVLGVARYDQHFYDAAYYQLQADRVAFGGGFTDPFLPITHPQAPPMPSAQHPPLTVVAALLLAYKLVRRPRLLTAAGLGAVCGLATLARAEVVLLAPLLAGWLLVSKRLPSVRSRLTSAATMLVASALVIAPWFGYNLARFHDATFVSTNDGIALLGSNCDIAYYGKLIGGTTLTAGHCLPVNPPPGDDSVVARAYRDQAFTYMRGHLQRLPVVLAARVGRDWSLFRPQDAVSETEGRPGWATELGLAFYYPLLALAIGGTVVLWRRRAPVWPLLVPVIIVTLSTVVSYGQVRFRVEAEPVLVVLASVASAAVFSWWRQRRREPQIGPDTAEVSGAHSSPASPHPLTLRQQWAALQPG